LKDIRLVGAPDLRSMRYPQCYRCGYFTNWRLSNNHGCACTNEKWRQEITDGYSRRGLRFEF